MTRKTCRTGKEVFLISGSQCIHVKKGSVLPICSEDRGTGEVRVMLDEVNRSLALKTEYLTDEKFGEIEGQMLRVKRNAQAAR